MCVACARVHVHRLPFVLEASDFPLQLTVRELRASLRGAEAQRAADGDAAARPAAYVTFHTEEIDWAARYWLWVGVPVGWVSLICCCCCCLCFCCDADDEEGGRRAKPPEFMNAVNEGAEDGLELDEGWRRRRVDPDAGGVPSPASGHQRRSARGEEEEEEDDDD